MAYDTTAVGAKEKTIQLGDAATLQASCIVSSGGGATAGIGLQFNSVDAYAHGSADNEAQGTGSSGIQQSGSTISTLSHGWSSVTVQPGVDTGSSRLLAYAAQVTGSTSSTATGYVDVNFVVNTTNSDGTPVVDTVTASEFASATRCQLIVMVTPTALADH